jgi:hypothetical protein
MTDVDLDLDELDSDADAAFVGAAIVTGKFSISVEELSVLLVAAAARPVLLDDLTDPTDVLLARLWRALIVVDPELAEVARMASAENGHLTAFLTINDLFLPTTPNESD